MADPVGISGCAVLAIMGIGFHILNQMPFKMPIRRRLKRFWWEVSWMFPRSDKKPRHGVFYFLFSIPFGLFAIGVEMTSKYTVVQWMFILTTVSSAVTAYVFFVILKPFARKFWTVVIAVVVGLGLFYLYSYLCPTVTIRPDKVVFGSIAESECAVLETHRFRIQNKIGSDVYSVTFELRVDSSDLNLGDFKYDVPQSSQKPLDETTELGRKLGDIGGVDCVDMRHRPVFVRVINHLAPSESREVTLTRLNPPANLAPAGIMPPPRIDLPEHGLGSVVVEARVVGFDDDSAAELGRPNFQVGGRLRPDEKLTCGAFSGISLGSTAPPPQALATHADSTQPTATRSYLAFDGTMRFGERRDSLGNLQADQNLHVGDELFFNFYFNPTGPNPTKLVHHDAPRQKSLGHCLCTPMPTPQELCPDAAGRSIHRADHHSRPSGMRR